MAQNKMVFHPAAGNADSGFGRMVFASLVAHALVVVLFSGLWLPAARTIDRPVYYVDLVNLPVERPQAGRPDGAKAEPQKSEKAAPKEEKTVKPAPAPAAEKVQVAPPKPPPVKEKAPEVKVPVKEAAPEKKAPAEKKAPPKAKPKTVEKDYQSVLSAVEALRAKKEQEQAKSSRKAQIEELKNKLAAMTAQDSRQAGAGTGAPLGMADGSGDQAGPSFDLWLYTYVRSNWSLSKYQLSRQDLEAEIHVVYDQNGNLIRKKLTRSSGDAVFDRSVEDAVLKSQKLPKAPGQRMEFEIIFNLKDLLEKN